MAEEFIDLYEVLELPLDTDRNTLRKRINESYLDAQRNLDHRNFQTRIKYQELFEVTLPQARYILLDESRRDDYDRLVRAFRASKSGIGVAPAADAAPAPPVTDEPGIPGTTPDVGPLPTANVDPAQLAKEREELWTKWKSGLENVLAEKEDTAPRPRVNHALPPTPPPAAGATPRQTDKVASPAGERKPLKPKVSFNFNDGAVKRPVSSAEEAELEKEKAKQEELERRRDHHRREIIKETLVNVGLIWSGVGAAVVIIPGFIAVTLASTFYLHPTNGAWPFPMVTKVPYWSVALFLLAVGSVFAARGLSRRKRQEAVSQLSRMPYEELLRTVNKSG